MEENQTNNGEEISPKYLFAFLGVMGAAILALGVKFIFDL